MNLPQIYVPTIHRNRATNYSLFPKLDPALRIRDAIIIFLKRVNNFGFFQRKCNAVPKTEDGVFAQFGGLGPSPSSQIARPHAKVRRAETHRVEQL